MAEVIAGVQVPDTAAVAEATRLIQETTSPLIYHHSRRVFFFSGIHADRLGVKPDLELLYLTAMFHDSGLATPFSDVEQRFEVDGADHAHRFLLERGFTPAAADTVWTAIALHTTPGVPARMGPEIATTYLGVLTEVLGLGLDGLDADQVEEVLAVHPRGDFKNEFLRTYFEGQKNRPDTTNGTVNADVLAHFIPDFRRTTTVERILGVGLAELTGPAELTRPDGEGPRPGRRGAPTGPWVALLARLPSDLPPQAITRIRRG